MHESLSPRLILAGGNAGGEFIRFDWKKRDENIILAKGRNQTPTEMWMRGKDGLSELCWFCHRGRPSPDEVRVEEHYSEDELLATFIWFSFVFRHLSLSSSPPFLLSSCFLLPPPTSLCRPKRANRRPRRSCHRRPRIARLQRRPTSNSCSPQYHEEYGSLPPKRHRLL